MEPNIYKQLESAPIGTEAQLLLNAFNNKGLRQGKAARTTGIKHLGRTITIPRTNKKANIELKINGKARVYGQTLDIKNDKGEPYKMYYLFYYGTHT